MKGVQRKIRLHIPDDLVTMRVEGGLLGQLQAAHICGHRVLRWTGNCLKIACEPHPKDIR